MHRDQDLHACDVAITLSCSVKTVHKLALKGKLRGYKCGAQWRFKQADVDAFRRPAPIAEQPAAPMPRVTPSRRGRDLPGWYDYDHSNRRPS